MSRMLTQKEIDALIKENNILKRENKYFKTLFNSKRFKFAEKIATSYNGIFPKNTKRRSMMESVGGTGKKILEANKAKKHKRIVKKIDKLVVGYDKVIVLNSIPWGLKLKQRPHHLAEEFSKLGFFVIYLEYENPLCDFKVIKKNLVTVNSEKSILELPKKGLDCYFLSPNNMSTRYEIIEKIVDKGYKFIYDYLDEFHEDISGDLSIQMGVWDRLKDLKPVLCLATAERLFRDLKKYLGNSQKVIIVRNAVNIEHFDFEKNDRGIPVDMTKILRTKKPIVGFYGALAPWIDFKMLNNIAKEHQEWEFVYLGVDYGGAAAQLKKMNNVHNLGAKNYSDLPKYVKCFDCATIPFKKGEIAKATSPVKLFEYMAAGLPTVCTRDLNECKGYEYVYISNDSEEFEKNIEKAIRDHGSLTKRRKLLNQAKKNTWEERARIISDALEGELKNA
ncbi:glycosyltransferase [Candidatus Saccharibacteria bacterium]|nr:glycosyltransferase [Candidatus Saccharibacteria bacterium]